MNCALENINQDAISIQFPIFLLFFFTTVSNLNLFSKANPETYVSEVIILTRRVLIVTNYTKLKSRWYLSWLAFIWLHENHAFQQHPLIWILPISFRFLQHMGLHMYYFKTVILQSLKQVTQEKFKQNWSYLII